MGGRQTLAGFGSYLGHVRETDRRAFELATALAVVATITESLGLLLLVPLLTTAGLVGDGDGGLPWLTDVLDAVGVPISFGWILVVYVVLIALRAAVGWWRQIVVAELQHEVVDGLRYRLFEAVARADWSFHLRHRTSDLSHTLTADVARVRSGTTAFFDVTARVVATIGYLVVAFRLSVPVSALAIVVVGVLVLGLWPIVRRSRSIGALQTVRGRDNFAVQQQFFDAMKLVKAHGTESEHVRRYRQGVDEVRETMVEHQRLSARSSALLQVGVAIAIAVLVWFAVEVVETDDARLLVLVAVIARLAPMASTLVNRAQFVANMLPAYASALDWIDRAAAAAEAAPGAATGRRLETAVELRDVSFAYADGRPVLASFDLDIPVGATVGLVGPSGAGKTTVADLLLGLIQPDTGHVLVDGEPLASFGLDDWRSQVAYVPQETFLFHDTLRTNIAGSSDPDEISDRLDGVVSAAALSDLVDSLPEGLETIVGDRGVRLSGGERQRVAIARALWREPTLLVLDEATSALDRDNERAVQDAIDGLRGSVTMLVIAHRLATLDRADTIIDLGDGGLTWAR